MSHEWREEGRAEGRADGRAQGRADGRADGRAQGRAEDVLLVLRARDVVVDDAVRERLSACGDVETLSRWLARAVTVEQAEDLFAGDDEG
ncbi:hypothetical protein [Actinacidiphila sp. ITFR-21]|uniref:hypothetical protein n=1 Tax=Actinacidiphila sp. ITFR-21 TaxID=3075199 RepID=UPI00288BE397|nr:hypothetical protein [Streptomyces sp. ITFR-21]WNI17405.1 hypothetical protein RLT57_19050 [Streptomyces sp. ITFR-21]